MMTQKKKSKYNNKRTRYNDVWYDSKMEASYASVLDCLKKAGEIKGWDRQPSYKLPCGIRWKIDFIVYRNDGSYYYVEVKGLATKDYKLKLELFKHSSKDELIVVKSIDQKAFPPKFRILEHVNKAN